MNNIYFEYDFGDGFAPGTPPRNWKAIKVQLIFTKDKPQYQLQSIVFEFVKDIATKIQQYQQAGMTGGTGITEGIGLKIFIGSNYELLFEGCLNTVDAAFEIETGIVKCPIKESGRSDWMETVAQSITFDYLANGIAAGQPGHISVSDYKRVPYTRSAAPDDQAQVLMLSVTTYIMVKEAYQTIDNIVNKIETITSHTLWWEIIIAVIFLLLELLYLCMILIECIALTQQIISLILPPKKYKLAMREVDLFKKFCEYFNLKFVSSIYAEGGAPDRYNGRYINATWMPVKVVIPITTGNIITNPIFNLITRAADEGAASSTAFGYYEGTPKQYIDEMCKKYNAEFLVKDGYAYFEMRFNFDFVNPFQLPNEGEVGYTYNYPQPYGFNAHEIKCTYIVRYQKDSEDLNTFDNYRGTYCLANTRAGVVRVQQNSLLQGTETIEIGAALARRKNYYTKIEEQLFKLMHKFENFYHVLVKNANDTVNLMGQSALGNNLLGITTNSVFNTAANSFIANMLLGGAPGSITGVWAVLPFVVNGVEQQIPDPNFVHLDVRIGWMLLSSDFTSQPKSFIGMDVGGDWILVDVDAGGQFHDANYANSLMSEFHAYNLGWNRYDLTRSNQWLTFKNKTFKLGIVEWRQIRNNNILVTADGKKGKFEQLMWEPVREIATGVDYRIKENWSNNLITVISDDNG
ncbi:hypothetical protein UFOVP916_40 [uncultured Caudovirales phage]|uniref:Uncharacterized protein n=1 Tax=uncultured Caudovirales phage TaxID=2100421 RepID=A0A6J5PI86_9CAUD|nr:hypothetical protein UFOVP827_61 [uncultured Caudovirales phage]CAB4171469.1 hypothetical protein UFOVP916_40 [uncultured Caudovirales phage]CAB4177473.1 hypothetical protein UFOVP1001_64 [uncultured Caudovirales phage]CAB4199016.1 hypothetical protein UFOVP1338_12 [uncultured Caudovirales phage]CAB4213333.1 hypothetical protein UFOVP1447_7 [uncultured Caudovirales phage]